MHTRSETDLRQLAAACLARYADTDDAWAVYRDEANARYSHEDDGDHAEYAEEATAIFEEAKLATVDLGDGEEAAA